MGESIRSQIIGKIVERLETGEKPDPELVIDRFTTGPIPQKSLVVYPIKETVTPVSHAAGMPLVSRGLIVRIEARAVGAVPDVALDPYLNYSVRRLMADRKLGGLCRKIEEVQIDWDAEPGKQTYARAWHHFLVTYQTRDDDPEKRT